MKQSLSIKASSFTWDSDLYIPDGFTAPTVKPVTTGWRSAGYACVLADGKKTGMAHVAILEEYTLSTGAATGNTKPNGATDPDYIPDYQDLIHCAPEQLHQLRMFNNTDQAVVFKLLGASPKSFNVAAHQYSVINLSAGKYDIQVSAADIANKKYHLATDANYTAISANNDTDVSVTGIVVPANLDLSTVDDPIPGTFKNLRLFNNTNSEVYIEVNGGTSPIAITLPRYETRNMDIEDVTYDVFINCPPVDGKLYKIYASTPTADKSPDSPTFVYAGGVKLPAEVNITMINE